MKKCVICLAAAMAFTSSTMVTHAGITFGTAANLGPMVNGPERDSTPNISDDGLTLYFYSNRGGINNWDLWMTTRATTSDPWTPAVNLGSPVNTAGSESRPSISADGLSLYFASRVSQPGDIWMATRPTTSDPWSARVNLGPTVNSSAGDHDPDISSDGLTLFFGSDRIGTSGARDLWMTTRATVSDPWGAPVNLGSPVNSSGFDMAANISADGLTLFLNSDRDDLGGKRRVYMTTRTSTSDPWSTPIKLDSPVNIPGYATTGVDISADGRSLFFASDRPGGQGDDDLWMVTIIPEPSSFVLLFIGAISLFGRTLRRKERPGGTGVSRAA